MKNYLYEYEVKERSYEAIPMTQYTACEMSKEFFLHNHLAPTLRAANCGWNWLEYKVMVASGNRTEFLILWAEDVGRSGSRWIDVTGDSLGSVMCAMCDNLW